MAKRSSIPRRKNDAYDTPAKAVDPLRLRLPDDFRFVEPCAGAGNLVGLLGSRRCVLACDIEPRADGIERRDAMSLNRRNVRSADYIITNPPWTVSILHPMIDHLAAMLPTWLLLDADYAHNLASVSRLAHCWEIVSVGRLKWIPDSPHMGKDNVAWYLFDRTRPRPTPAPLFIPRIVDRP